MKWKQAELSIIGVYKIVLKNEIVVTKRNISLIQARIVRPMNHLFCVLTREV